MKIAQARWNARHGWKPGVPGLLGDRASLVLVFGEAGALREGTALAEIRRAHPRVPLFGCSRPTGEHGAPPRDESLVVRVLRFETTGVRLARTRVAGAEDSHRAGLRLALALPSWGLTHVLLLCDGLRVDGAALVRGMTAALPSDAAIFGAPSWGRERLEETLVVGGGVAELGTAVAVGLYGTRVRVRQGSHADAPFDLDERPAGPAPERGLDPAIGADSLA